MDPSGLYFAQPSDISKCEGVFKSDTSGDTDVAGRFFVGEGFGKCDDIGGLYKISKRIQMIERREKAEKRTKSTSAAWINCCSAP